MRAATKRVSDAPAAVRETHVPKNLVIVESPAKAKTIERYLGKDYRVAASMGHVRDLPPKELGVDVAHDFEPTYTLLKNKSKIVSGLKKAAKGVETVYMATDLDREGEAIAWHLCQALDLAPEAVRRVVFSEITKGAIQRAFREPGDLNMEKVAAQEARRILDRLVGYKLSPLLWKKVAKGLSAGRVQSVAVRILVEREREIRDFKPEEFWRIAAILARPDEKGEFKAQLAKVDGEKFRPSGEAGAKTVGEAMRRAVYTVRAVKRRRVQDKAPPPFITSQLQQAASTRLSFSTRKTMTLAQRLYQGVELRSEGPVALITYMRTDSYHVAPSARQAARETIAKEFGDAYLPEKPPAYRSRGRAQEAHEAIRPTDVSRTPESVKGLLERDEARLYELIWKRFIASQMRPALWDVTDAEIEAAADSMTGLFKARGRTLIYDGHTRVTGVRMGKDEQQLPPLEEGEKLDLKSLEETQHFTQPPPRYSEAGLVKRLEQLGIGRPSTYATIVSTIQERGYARQEKRRFYATELGEVVTDKLVKHFPKIMDVGFTSHMEDQLDEVEDAKTDSLKVIREFWDPFAEALQKAKDEMESEKHQPVEDAGPCPDCGKPLVKRWSKTGPFLGCSGFPDCKYTRNPDGQERPEPVRTEHTCDKCGGTMLLRVNKKGEPFLGCENFPKCRSTLPSDADGNPIRPEPTGEVCEKCGAEMVIKRGRRGPFLACSAFPKCRNAKPLPGEKKAKGAPKKGAGRPRTSRPKPQVTDRECPDCGKKLVLRSGRRGNFLGCSGYPKCRHTEDVPADLEIEESA